MGSSPRPEESPQAWFCRHSLLSLLSLQSLQQQAHLVSLLTVLWERGTAVTVLGLHHELTCWLALSQLQLSALKGLSLSCSQLLAPSSWMSALREFSRSALGNHSSQLPSGSLPLSVPRSQLSSSLASFPGSLTLSPWFFSLEVSLPGSPP